MFEVSDKVPKGEAYLKDTFNYYCKYYNCKNKKLTMSVSNIYYEDSIDLKITKVYDKNNANRLLDIKYDNVDNVVYISNEDFEYLFNKGNYQSSVFVKEIKDLNNVKKDINDLGYDTFLLRESKHDDAKTIMQVFKIFRLVLIIILLVALFFISYFIIKLIYKSRNSYYTTLRTLGSTKSICVNILRKELITVASIVYIVFLVLMYLVKISVIKGEFFKDMLLYLTIKEYIIIYIILIIISVLISLRYGRKIFKDSIIKTYGERI
jgi:hypothetical protein